MRTNFYNIAFLISCIAGAGIVSTPNDPVMAATVSYNVSGTFGYFFSSMINWK
jgi:hypothetical protein